MPYDEAHLTRIADLKDLAELVKTKIDDLTEFELALRTQIQTLSSRYDANVKASTDSDSDYAAEVADARVDSWANEYASLGANIREGQMRLAEALADLEASIQTQLNSLSEVRIGNLIDDVEAHQRRKQEIFQEASERRESDSSLQSQIQLLSEASLRTIVIVSEIKEVLRNF